MKKTYGIVCLIASICFLFGACSKSESYADKVKKEKKRISSFIKEHNIEVLNDYPANGVFKSNEFYLDPSGVYINVVDSGNGKRANADTRAEVYFRFRDAMWLPTSESDTISLSDVSTQPLGFNYGVTATYTYYDYSTNIIPYYYLSPGVTIPLQYVGENAIVKLIVPFRNSIGSAYQRDAYTTIYFDYLEYTRIIN